MSEFNRREGNKDKDKDKDKEKDNDKDKKSRKKAQNPKLHGSRGKGKRGARKSDTVQL